MHSSFLSNRVLSSQSSATVGIADKVKSMREAGKTVYDFSAGRAFEPTPIYVSDAAIAAIRAGDTHQTMAKGTTAYRQACAQKLKRENGINADPETEIVGTLGCKQGLTVALLAILNPGEEVIVEDPCFVSYIQTIQYLGGIATPVPLMKENQYRWKETQLEKAITDKTKAIILCSPQNPTGVVHRKEDLEVIADVAIKHNLIVITDEPYERSVFAGRKHICLATLPGMADRTITLMSLTKSFSMGGWRIGFAHASAAIVEQMTKLQQHLITSPNAFVQAGAAVAFGQPPKDEVMKYWKEWEEKVLFFTKELDSITALKCYTPEGGFYGWVDITATGLSSEAFASRLLEEEQAAIIPGDAFGSQGEGYVRITCVKSWEEIKGGLERIKLFCDKL